MKATWFALVVALAVGSGCRASRLGQPPVIRAAFAAQAQKSSKEASPMDATDAQLVMARHREPMVPQQTAGDSQTMTLPAPKLGSSSP